MNQSHPTELNSPPSDRYNQFQKIRLLNFNSTMFKLSNYWFKGLLSVGIILGQIPLLLISSKPALADDHISNVSPAVGQIVINEVLYRQAGSSAAGNNEFIELYNASDTAVDISDWQLIDGNLQIDDTDGAGSINDGITESFVFPGGTIVNPGEYIVVWIGTDTSNRNAEDAAFQFYLGNAPRLNNNGDDIWLYDSQTRIVDYMAYGTDNAINTPPDASLNLWDDTFQSDLLNTSQADQSISLTPTGQDSNSAACWEPTTSNDAAVRCTGFFPTRDSDEVANRISSEGISNNIVKISGTVFEDINYGGGPGRNLATAKSSASNSQIGVQYTLVELYSYDGIDRNSSELIAIAETDEDGYYLFEEDDNGEELPAGHYLIRVANDIIQSQRESIGLGHLAVQTFRNDPDEATTEITNEVGGAYPALDDDDLDNFGDSLPDNAQSVTAINAVGEVSNVDFGFNFYTIVNTNNDGRGSLRQFLRNSQDLDNDNLAQDLPTTITAPSDSNGTPVTLTDYETSIFMIPDPNSDSRVNAGTGVGEINLTNSPPDGGVGSAFVIDISGNDELRVFSNYISIDGRTQTANIPSVANTPNLTIGSNETTGPEVILNRSSTGDLIRVQDGDIIFHSLGIISPENINSTGLLISDDAGLGSQLANTNNVIMEELTVSTGSCGIRGVTMTESVIRNSVIRDTGGERRNQCNNIQLREQSNSNLIENNLILRSAYYGINLISNINTGNIIRNNSIVGNGAARSRSQTSGIRLREGINTTITENIIRDNIGDGITINDNSPRLPANDGNLISKNSIYNNGDLGIDLDSGRSSRGNGVTLNDTGDGDIGGNQLQNFPVINEIISDGTNYTITGTFDSTPASNFEIELFSNAVCNANIGGTPRPSNDEDNYGEGERYHGATVDTDDDGNTTFSATVAINDLAGSFFTATATNTTTNNTSEFSQCFTTNPNLILVKRITAINPGQSDERLFSNFVDDGTEDEDKKDDDTNPMWLGASENSNTYTLGEINGGTVKPGDEVEYTIYFLSSGNNTAKNVLVCDLIPDNMELVPRSFKKESAASGGIAGADRGMLWEYDGIRESLTNDNDGDSGYYFAPGIEPNTVLPNVICDSSASPNTQGAVVVDLGDLPGATAPGTPTNSYGFIRFRAKVK